METRFQTNYILKQRASSSDREEGSKQQRARELEAMLRARNESGSRAGNPESEDPEKLFAQRQREERARELEEVAQLRATSIAHNLWVLISQQPFCIGIEKNDTY